MLKRKIPPLLLQHHIKLDEFGIPHRTGSVQHQIPLIVCQAGFLVRECRCNEFFTRF